MLWCYITLNFEEDSLNLYLDARDQLPLYAQLARQLRQAIALGDWSSSRPLPSVRALVGSLKVNHQTVLRAFAELEADGLVERRQGQGTFVVPEAAEASARRRQHEILQDLTRLAGLARELGVGNDTIAAAVSPPEKGHADAP